MYVVFHGGSDGLTLTQFFKIKAAGCSGNFSQQEKVKGEGRHRRGRSEVKLATAGGGQGSRSIV